VPKRKPGRDAGTEPPPSEQSPSDRLDSWKEIAAYFRRDIRTLHRWEKAEGLPVHRHVHSKAGTVYANKTELDAWWKERRLRIVTEEERSPVSVRRWKLAIALTALVLIGAALVWKYAVPARPFTQPPRPSSIQGRLLANATTEGRTLRLIPVGDSPEYAAATPNGSEIYVANSESNTVSVISTATNAVTHTIAVGGNPRVMVIPRDGKRVYVCNRLGNLSVIETATKTVSTIETEGPLSDLALAADGSRAYIALGFRGLKELLLPSNRITTIPTMAAPMYLALTADGSRLYINYQSSGPGGRPGHDAIDILDVTSGRFVGNLSGPPNVGGPLVLSPDGRQVWAHGLDACRAPAYDHVGCTVVPGEVVNVM
jgi:YVTN family beta-propeller protein